MADNTKSNSEYQRVIQELWQFLDIWPLKLKKSLRQNVDHWLHHLCCLFMARYGGNHFALPESSAADSTGACAMEVDSYEGEGSAAGLTAAAASRPANPAADSSDLAPRSTRSRVAAATAAAAAPSHEWKYFDFVHDGRCIVRGCSGLPQPGVCEECMYSCLRQSASVDHDLVYWPLAELGEAATPLSVLAERQQARKNYTLMAHFDLVQERVFTDSWTYIHADWESSGKFRYATKSSEAEVDLLQSSWIIRMLEESGRLDVVEEELPKEMKTILDYAGLQLLKLGYSKDDPIFKFTFRRVASDEITAPDRAADGSPVDVSDSTAESEPEEQTGADMSDHESEDAPPEIQAPAAAAGPARQAGKRPREDNTAAASSTNESNSETSSRKRSRRSANGKKALLAASAGRNGAASSPSSEDDDVPLPRQVVAEVRALIQSKDLEQLSRKKVREQVSEKLNIPVISLEGKNTLSKLNVLIDEEKKKKLAAGKP
jgi:hypothetical protein